MQEIRLEINTNETKYMVVSRRKVGDVYVKMNNNLFQRVDELKKYDQF